MIFDYIIVYFRSFIFFPSQKLIGTNMTREKIIDCVIRAKTNRFAANLHEVSSHIRVLNKVSQGRRTAANRRLGVRSAPLLGFLKVMI